MERVTSQISGWMAVASVVAFVATALPEKGHAAEPITTTGVIVGSTIGAGLPGGLSGLGTGTGVYVYTFSGVSLGGGAAFGGAVATGALIVGGIALVGALAVGGYLLYRHFEKKREDARVAAGSNVPRHAATTAGVARSPSAVAPSRSIGGAAGAGMSR